MTNTGAAYYVDDQSLQDEIFENLSVNPNYD